MSDNKSIPHISVVSPVYAAENIVAKLVEAIELELAKVTHDFEIILVEDNGPDRSWEKIQEISRTHSRVKGVRLSRNFGQHYAITAGLEESRGEWVVVMDCDLQDNPAEIVNLYRKAKEGFEVVMAQRKTRNDKFLKRKSSELFYTVFGYLTDTKQDPSVANFGIYHRKVIASILSMGDYYRYFPTMVQWVGFNRAYLPVQHNSREEGKSSYSIKKLFRLAFDNIVAFSDKPLRLTIRLGIWVILTSFGFGLYNLYKYFIGEITELGYTSLILSIWFLSGIIIFTLGIVGVYIGKSFDTLKERPTHIISERTQSTANDAD